MLVVMFLVQSPLSDLHKNKNRHDYEYSMAQRRQVLSGKVFQQQTRLHLAQRINFHSNRLAS